MGFFLLMLAACSRGEKREQPEPAPSAPPVLPPSASVAPPPPPGSAARVEPVPDEPETEATTIDEQRARMFARMQSVLGVSDEEIGRVRELFGKSKILSQGNPQITKHPMTRAECQKRRKDAGNLPEGDARCGKPNMVPLYDPKAGEEPEHAKVCIDQYEFPNIACEYPVVYARAVEAARLCSALGKRLCDAHEWEGACAGALLPAEREYAFGQRRMMIEYLHNKDREIVWAYGPTKDHSKCATSSKKSPKCYAGGWTLCGSNTFPAGAFPECRSRLGVFDQHGNAAEHMNLPLAPEQLASRGGLGETEMKGSWFIFSTTEAHIDDCRWRAPMWHHTRVDDENSHSNYHLGFRCCRDITQP